MTARSILYWLLTMNAMSMFSCNPKPHGENLAFKAPAAVAGVTVSGYEVFRDGMDVATILSAKTTTYFDPAPAGTHSWYVVALGSNGTQSKPSNTFSGIVP